MLLEVAKALLTSLYLLGVLQSKETTQTLDEQLFSVISIRRHLGLPQTVYGFAGPGKILL